MSQTPNNPFDTQPNQFGHHQQSPKASGGGKTWLWVLGILAGMFLLSALVCCGVIWYGTNELAKFGGEAVVEKYGNDPAVLERIGDIQSSKMILTEMASESNKDDEIIALVVEVEGSKGSGKIIERTNTITDEETAVLILSDGTEYALEAVADEDMQDIESALEEFEDFESMDENLDQSADGAAAAE